MPKILNNPNQKELRRKLRRNATETEQLLWGFLRKKGLGFKFVRQYGVGKYILDFYCPSKKIAVEIDGGQHNTDESIEYDKERTASIESLGIEVLRFWNTDVFHNVESVCDTILKQLKKRN